MAHENSGHLSAGQSILNLLNMGGPPPNLALLGGYPMTHPSPNAPDSRAAQGPIQGSVLGPVHSQVHPMNVLKLTGLPTGLSQREAGLIFSLVIDDVLGIDMNETEQSMTVAFTNPGTCIVASRSLDGKYIFGQGEAPAKVEYDAGNLAISSSTAAFDSLRLSTSNLSPPQPHQQQHSSGSLGIDNFQKRSFIGNQRSRFLFSDQFLGSSKPATGNPGSIDLSDLTGKSLLLMKQSDGREYENMARDPWASQSQGNIGFHSNPQMPGVTPVHASYDWGPASAAANMPTSASASSSQAPQPPHSQQGPPMHPVHAASTGNAQISPFITLASGDRSRTSTFFNGPPGHNSVQPPPLGLEPQSQQNQTPASSLQGHLPEEAQALIEQEQKQHKQNPASQTVASIISLEPTQHPSEPLPPLSIPSNPPTRNGPISTGPQSASFNPQSASTPPGASAMTPSSASARKDVPDLSLLARVPPPANPADQNPPCNTLYVGNLPPDATETELRSLFALQKGFRRLSFRTKNQTAGSSSGGGASSHSHGPMCFVEFEDVAHATVTLAELYGRALPRPGGSSGKGGIRLSFSKNPLGVRGPGNTRRTTTNAQPTLAGGTSNGVGNYGYSSNYH